MKPGKCTEHEKLSVPQQTICALCTKKGSEHSEKLWQIHKLAIEKGRRCAVHHREEKLYPTTVGFARKCIARVCTLENVHFSAKTYDREQIPIYMSCQECGLYLGNIEEDYADILDEMCLKCFREQTEQTHDWYNIPPVLKGEQCVVCDIVFFGRSDSDKCRKCRKEDPIFDPDWLIKKHATESVNC